MLEEARSMHPPRSEALRIALVCGDWLPASETFIFDQVVQQQKTEALVVARRRTPIAARFPYDQVKTVGLLRHFLRYQLGWGAGLRRIIQAHGAQVIHTHFGTNGASMLPIAKELGLPLVISWHGHDVAGLAHKNRSSLRYQHLYRNRAELMQTTALHLCASEELRDILLASGAPQERVRVHELGVDVGRFVPDKTKRRGQRLLMVGRLVEKKGVPDAISAFSRIATQHESAELRIVGDGPLRQSLEAQIQELGLSKRVQLLGEQSSSVVLEEMQAASMLLIPSFTTAGGDRESGVIVAKEAGAVELPVIGTLHGGLPQIIEHEGSGYLVPERDVAALSECMDTLLSDRRLQEKMGARARAIVTERFDTKVRNAALEEQLLRVARSWSGL